MIGQLAKANGIDVGNVKLIYPLNSDQTGEGLLAFFIPHSYPTTAMYENGVSMLSLIATRPDPTAKISNQTLRVRANQMIAENNIYEVLLVNEDGLITEGSRSNIFFVQNDQVVTSPENLVLAGITRNLIIQICRNENIPFAEKKITYPDLGSFSAAFITGTSPKVLPVNKIDDFRYHTGNPVVLKIMRKYDEIIEEYLAKNK
jgi:branched-chain amino acid aminotransferase